MVSEYISAGMCCRFGDQEEKMNGEEKDTKEESVPADEPRETTQKIQDCGFGERSLFDGSAWKTRTPGERYQKEERESVTSTGGSGNRESCHRDWRGARRLIPAPVGSKRTFRPSGHTIRHRTGQSFQST